ncbi:MULTISPECIES: carboxy terminal-processing peptidase [Acinetobacter calcoaceticus/baumannii complex]|uniref:carboxy terminal-processing peptidase n=1 Tax=Acinetobacter calcoaceticus/baumannii complex TaxID=909768 RepID=UPI0004522B01|nr:MULTISPECIES: carboxy terminal-processing peptidase [Acinetobacter calcoaceticus/baumannii complex]EXR42606.1 C-terminal processing peptidase family protein [Acinetobacter sp. 1294243]KCX17565.1 C-terminal processing peptidase family protein [Acinetobacter sp. 1264765]KQE12437.1 peptidase S41 [Acinetobacter pittii]MBT1523604.1 carboxy terminal-processing peptidase [Acinetobacter pittii]MCK0878745.1 carboxy terminal-processing peptidase [Acinetobacter pittii]
MKLQTIACAVAIATGGLFFSHTMNEARAATNTAAVSQSIQPTQEQALVARQLATLVDRQHYLNMRLDATTSNRILDMYLDSLDPDHSLFLDSEVQNYKKLYGSNFGASLKAGNLTGPFAIHQQYRERLKQFYEFMLAELKQQQNLKQPNSYIEVDREKAPYFKTTAEQQNHWRKMLVSQLINLTISREEEQAKQKALKENPSLADGQDLTGPEDLTPAQTLTKRYTRQLERISRVKSDDVLDKTLNAMLATYDPHSNYYPPIDAIELNRQTTLQLEGIGVSIRPERGNEDYTKIETIVEGGPASKSGQVKSGDRIIGVAQEGEKMIDVIGWTSSEIVGLIRGKRGTKVTLKLLGAGASMSQARNVTLVRDVIQEEDAGVRSRTVEVTRDGKKHVLGVIEIPSFYFDYRSRRAGKQYRSVSEDTANAFEALKAKKVEGIIIDLRNDPGGSLEEVARMLGQVIKSGPVVQIRDGNGNVSVFEDNDGGQQIYTGPLAVLVNLASASASEIYSAAIQDYERGIIIGSTTTGKGTAQVQLDTLAYGQATLTQRKFYRITGGSTQNKGVVPDIKLVDIYNEEFGERKSKNALKWDTIPTAPFKREGSVQPYVTKLSQFSEQRVANDAQFKYLNKRTAIAKMTSDQKQVVLDIDKRRAELLGLEKQTLDAENQRRAATGQKPFANWESYQASLDALAESRAKMKASQRPALPEEETFVTEAANVLMDYAKLQNR